jgi:hypothetical protein
MPLHAFDSNHPSVPAPAGTGLPWSQPRSFAVRVRFATPAARAGGFEVVAAEVRVGIPGAAGRLGSVAEVAARDLLILVDGAADPDAALGVATEALRESLLPFEVATIAPPNDATSGRPA